MEENRQEELEQEEKEAEVSEEIEDKAAWKNKARPATMVWQVLSRLSVLQYV